MRNLLLLCFVLVLFEGFGQKTKKVKVYNDREDLIEKYFVLKTDESVKHGFYTNFDTRGHIISSGYYNQNKKDTGWIEYYPNSYDVQYKGDYKNGRKDGIWTEYKRKGKRTALIKNKTEYSNNQKNGKWIQYYPVMGNNTVRSIGEYKNDKLVGSYKYFNKDSTLRFEYDYTNSVLINYYDDKTTRIKTDSGIFEVKLDNPPLHIDGLHYGGYGPPQLRHTRLSDDRERRHGTVIVSFYIDTLGNAIDYKVIQELGKYYDERVLNSAKSIPNNWIVAKLNGKKVIAEYIYKYNFGVGYSRP